MRPAPGGGRPLSLSHWPAPCPDIGVHRRGPSCAATCAGASLTASPRLRRRNMPPAPRHPTACDTTVIDDCWRWRQEFSLSRSLGSGKSNRTKDCRGHILAITGVNTAVGLRSMGTRSMSTARATRSSGPTSAVTSGGTTCRVRSAAWWRRSCGRTSNGRTGNRSRRLCVASRARPSFRTSQDRHAGTRPVGGPGRRRWGHSGVSPVGAVFAAGMICVGRDGAGLPERQARWSRETEDLDQHLPGRDLGGVG